MFLVNPYILCFLRAPVGAPALVDNVGLPAVGVESRIQSRVAYNLGEIREAVEVRHLRKESRSVRIRSGSDVSRAVAQSAAAVRTFVECVKMTN